jgi:hypothetical protein
MRRKALFDGFPAGEDTDWHQEDGEHDQHQRDAINPQIPAKGPEQREPFHKLPLRAANVIAHPQINSEDEEDGRYCKRQPACAIGAEEQREDRGHEGQQDHG